MSIQQIFVIIIRYQNLQIMLLSNTLEREYMMEYIEIFGVKGTGLKDTGVWC